MDDLRGDVRTALRGEGEESMTQEQFDTMFARAMAEYTARAEKESASGWARDAWERAAARGVFDGTKPRAPLTREQAALADKVIRLHVLANSDSEADQALKLRVRDRILAEAADLFAPGETVAQARETLTLALPALAEAGAEVVREEGYEYAVSASLEENVWFPTKQYTDFALPQGSYTALRVVIGEGGGRNWWCVVFPPLCLGSVTETTEEAAALGDLSESDVALMTGEDEGYVVKFKAIELWEDFKGWAEGR